MNNRLKIAILDCTKTIYNEEMSEKIPLGGIERCIVSLSRKLFEKNCDVHVFGNNHKANTFNDITWQNLSEKTDFKADIVIACNDAKLFDTYAYQSGRRNFIPYLWHHNPVEIWKTIRKGRLMPLLKWNPVTVFLGDTHYTTSPLFMPARQNIIIEHGIEDSILNDTIPNNLRPPHAAYISQAYRGLDRVITIWKNYVFPQNPLAKLFVYSDYDENDKDDLSHCGIFVVGRVPRDKLLENLKDKRIVLIPGHKDETFCLSAKESHCLGIPVVTFGMGCLKDRVKSNYNGFIATDDKNFADKIDLLLNNDTVWTSMSNNSLLHRNQSSWAEKADIWLSHFMGQRHDS